MFSCQTKQPPDSVPGSPQHFPVFFSPNGVCFFSSVPDSARDSQVEDLLCSVRDFELTPWPG